MRHLLAIATRLGMSRTFFTSAALIVAGISLSSSAQALSFCDSKTPCAAGSQCFGWLCVPTAAVCNPAAPACASWQTCDMTCKIMGSSSGGTSTADAGAAVDGSSGSGSGSSGGSGGSGAVPKPPADGGSSDPMPPPQDAGSSADASYPDDAKSPMPEDDGGGYVPPADCPKNIGVCLPDPAKIVPQPGCEALCTAMGKCGGLGGNSTDPGEAPPPQPGDAGPAPSVDAGSSSPDAGAGFAPKPEDAASGDGGNSDKMIPPDGGGADVPPPGPNPEQIKSCVMACSVIKLGGYAKVEFAAMEQCIAKGAADCKTLESNCSKEADAFEDAVKDDEGLQLALMSLGGGGGSGVPEPGKDSDAGSQSGGDSSTSADATGGSADIALGVDAGSTDTSGNGGNGDAAESKDSGGGAPQNLDATTGKDTSTGADAATTGTGSAASSSKSDGCTASPSAAHPGALALLLIGLIGLVRRRKQVRARV